MKPLPFQMLLIVNTVELKGSIWNLLAFVALAERSLLWLRQCLMILSVCLLKMMKKALTLEIMFEPIIITWDLRPLLQDMTQN